VSRMGWTYFANLCANRKYRKACIFSNVSVITHWLIVFALIGVLFIYEQPAFSAGRMIATVNLNDSEKTKFEDDVVQRLRTRIQQDLNKYCSDGCSILGIDVESREVFDTSSASLGFETTPQSVRTFVASRSVAEILIDNRLGQANIERIQDVLSRSSRRYGFPIELEFTRATLPDPLNVVRAEAEAKAEALELVKNSIERILNDFCPAECRLQSVEVKTSRIPLEDAQSSMSRRAVVIRESKLALLVTGVTALLSLDSQMTNERRQQIENLVRENIETYGQSVLNVKMTAFPKSAKEIQKDADDLRSDPWGLERLGRALKVFREFANTKEIIRERDSLSRESEKERSREQMSERSSLSKETNNSRESEQMQLRSDSQKTSENGGFLSSLTREKVILLGALICALLIIAAFGLRYVLTGKKVQHLIAEGRTGQAGMADAMEQGAQDPALSLMTDASGYAGPRAHAYPAHGRVMPTASLSVNDEVAQMMNIQALRDELTQVFISQPKVAREVFARVLREDGIEFAAKCVSVLGEILVFDLMGDDDVKKEVALLAEYIHVNAPIVGSAEQLAVLRNLKLKMTAGKMRQMTQRTRDDFDFLKSYSPRQLYDLIADESSRSQAVVLTQLPTDKRRAVFELFEGTLRSSLLKELCMRETLPRDYLFNVAQALKRKLQLLGTQDGEILGGADVIIELMERGDRASQEEMLENLDRTNSELSRKVRSQLVSVETLAYLSDGHLLEIFLALDPQVMVTFIAGTRERIRQLILSKAPEEVADDWNESASRVRGFDGESFRFAEMQVLAKIRSLAATGLVNLAEINEMMFPRMQSADVETTVKESARRFKISSPVVA